MYAVNCEPAIRGHDRSIAIANIETDQIDKQASPESPSTQTNQCSVQYDRISAPPSQTAASVHDATAATRLRPSLSVRNPVIAAPTPPATRPHPPLIAPNASTSHFSSP